MIHVSKGYYRCYQVYETRAFIFTPSLVGILAFLLSFVPVFLRKFNDPPAGPIAHTSMVTVIVVGGPGNPVEP